MFVDEMPPSSKMNTIPHRFTFDLASVIHVNSLFEIIEAANVEPFEANFFEKFDFVNWCKLPYDRFYFQFTLPIGSNRDGYSVVEDHLEIGAAIEEENMVLLCRYKHGKPFYMPSFYDFRTKQAYLMKDLPRDFYKHSGYSDGQFVFLNEVAMVFALGCLMTLNMPSATKVNRVGASSKFVGNKRVAYKAHNQVTVDLAEARQHLRTFNTGTRGPVRRHSVRGTWVTYFRNADGCPHAQAHGDHDFVAREVRNPDPSKPRYVCRSCGQYRTWKPSFERGDARIGYATKNYEITSSRFACH